MDDAKAIWLTIATFGVPFLLTLALNHGLYYIKKSKRKKRTKLRPSARFFDTTIHPGDTGRSTEVGKDLAG